MTSDHQLAPIGGLTRKGQYMERWHLLLVVACITAPLALAVEIKRPSQSASANSRTKQNAAEPPSAFPASAAFAIQRSLESIAAAQIAQPTGEKSSEEKKREQDDLAAQQEMAFWAKAMFLATLFSTVISAVAGWLLFLTLKQSKRATYAALRAAVAGRQSVRVARQSSERQLRAYILPMTATAEWSEEKDLLMRQILVTVTTTNTGQTPGRKVISWITADSKLSDDRTFPDPKDSPVRSIGVQAPGQTQKFMYWHTAPHWTEDILEKWKRGDETFAVWGRIEYEDVFGNSRWSTFRLMIPSEAVGDDGGSFIACAEGNDAT